ncbi:hypothetical protein QA640_31220 [Bradyrhizobium sp. CB82]|uniref:hypothetical protein n=1 Tax=Bradyrhizobium sp. CB82 TaxID=3039159 RepID=UPI0024B221AF|nr:hypothetical protein [Bradyrhizobium sp. CB82]WFU38845.1 hypothetical protein QA640_31220 [Bradyrhizobium sp. CB82]
MMLFVLPFPSRTQLKRIAAIKTTSASIVIVGPSTIDYVSKCDIDHRTIPSMLSEFSGLQVLDLSFGGQPLSDSINLAAVSSRSSSITDVFLPLAYPQIDDWTTPTYRELLIYKAVVPTFRVFAASGPEDLWNGLIGEPRRLEQSFRFEGKSYPDYRVLAAGEFLREKRLATCPELETHDPAFTRGYFWWTHVAKTVNGALYDLVADLRAELLARGKRLHVVLLPINLGLIGRFEESWVVVLKDKQRHLVAEMYRRGIEIIDLSNGFASDEFSTQWCACIHLNDKGRLHLAREMAADLNSTGAGSKRRAEPSLSLSSNGVRQ